MTKVQSNVASFVLRFTQELWQDAQGEPHIQWRGHIRYVQGDEEGRFTDFAEAVAFIQRYLTQLAMEALPVSETIKQEKIFHESFKFWEQFASGYTGMVFEAIEQSIKQSETLKKQMDVAVEKALKAWQLPSGQSNLNQDQVLEALTNIQREVQALAYKVDNLERSLQQDESTG